MAKFEFIVKVENLENSSLKSATSNGNIGAENVMDAARQTIEIAGKMHGKFKKVTITLEEK